MERVRIAVARRKPAQPDRQRTGKHSVLRGEGLAPLVLLVDDCEETRELYSEFFLHSGLRVAQAVDGDHALWKVMIVKPDLVVMDLAMPGVDGWEATREIKSHAKMKHVPVIALTGHVSAENLRRAEEAGAEAVLTKPCLPGELLAAVRTLLAR